MHFSNMSRLIFSNILYKSLVSRTLNKTIQRQNVPLRFLASWGQDLPKVDPKEIELRVLKSISTHDKIDLKSVSFYP